jgi:hypothetical protein
MGDGSLTSLNLRNFSKERRGPDEPPLIGEVEGFRDIKRGLVRIGILFLSFFPWRFLAGLVSPSLSYPAGLVWLLAVFIAVNLFLASRCPRCCESCFRKGLSRDTFAVRCVHCGTKLYWPNKDLSG